MLGALPGWTVKLPLAVESLHEKVRSELSQGLNKYLPRVPTVDDIPTRKN